MRQRLQNFMSGRYGGDTLYLFLIASALIIDIIARIFRLYIFRFAALFMLGFAIFRFFSRNTVRRRAENDAFLDFWRPLSQKIRGMRDRAKSRKTHKFFKCPHCKNMLRVPRGKGKIQITCPRCGDRFERKS